MRLYFAIIFFFLWLSSTVLGSERERIGSEIKSLATDLSCDADYQCKTVGYGSRNCGGFDEYIIYSTKLVNIDYMTSLSQRYYELDKQHDTGASICVVAQPRVSACINNSCTDLGEEQNAITPLHWAAEREDIALINKLINQGFDINTKTDFLGDTALQHSIRLKKSLTIIKLLIELGADVNVAKHSLEESRQTPLHLAVSTKRYELIKFLVDRGANRNSGGKFTPYYYAEVRLKDHPKYEEIRALLRPDHFEDKEVNDECLSNKAGMTTKAWVYECLKIGPKPKGVIY